MQQVRRADVKRLTNYIDDFKKSPYRAAQEIKLNELSNLMNKVGFTGPANKSGTVKGFSHELLQSHPMLVDGQFTVHIAGKKVVTIRYLDFKKYVLPYIEQVLAAFEEQGLITEEDENV